MDKRIAFADFFRKEDSVFIVAKKLKRKVTVQVV